MIEFLGCQQHLYHSLYISNYDWMPSIPKNARNWWNYDTAVIPVNTGDHWNCIVIYMGTTKKWMESCTYTLM